MKSYSKDVFKVFGLLFVLISFLLFFSSAALAGKNGLYFLDIGHDEMNIVDNTATVSCNQYDDHAFYYYLSDEPVYPGIIQSDPILGVSVLCGVDEFASKPVYVINSYIGDNYEYLDAEDFYIDVYSATAYCEGISDSNLGVIRPPDRIILECLKHNVLINKKK